MQQFRKKPVVVEAIKWDGRNFAELNDFTGGRFRRRRVPEGVPDMRGEVFDVLHDTWVTVYPGQWVIRGVQGEFYPCAADVFDATYEPVPDEGDHKESFARHQTSATLAEG